MLSSGNISVSVSLTDNRYSLYTPGVVFTNAATSLSLSRSFLPHFSDAFTVYYLYIHIYYVNLIDYEPWMFTLLSLCMALLLNIMINYTRVNNVFFTFCAL